MTVVTADEWEPYTYVHNFAAVEDERAKHVADIGCWCGVILRAVTGHVRELKHSHSPAALEVS